MNNKLNYQLKTRAERVKEVGRLLEENTPISASTLTEYILSAEKEDYVLSKGRQQTINKREVNGVSIPETPSILTASNKLDAKTFISASDIENNPDLKALHDTIEQTKKMLERKKGKSGKVAYYIQQHLVQMYQDQYVIKGDAPYNPTPNTAIAPPRGGDMDFLDLTNPRHVFAILNNYSALKQSSYDKINGDLKWVLLDLEKYIDAAIQDNPIYHEILIRKIDGESAEEILLALPNKHSMSWLSDTWKHRIPKLIAAAAYEDHLLWYLTNKVKTNWKKCKCCGEIKPAHPHFFGRNQGGLYGYYSLCKKCKNKKNRERANAANTK